MILTPVGSPARPPRRPAPHLGAGAGAVLLLAVGWLKIPLAVGPMIAVTVVLALFNLATQWRLQRPRPVGDDEILAQLLVDVAALGVLLYYAGGSANPSSRSFWYRSRLPPLRCRPHAWFMGRRDGAGSHLPDVLEPAAAGTAGQMAELDALLARASGVAPSTARHLQRLRPACARHVAELHDQHRGGDAVPDAHGRRTEAARAGTGSGPRNRALRHEQILAMGTLAAGAAHQLGTPLATMAVVLHEAELAHGDQPELGEDLRLLRQQVDERKKILSQTLASAGQARDAASKELSLDAYLERLLEDWRLIRPRVAINAWLAGPRPAPQIATDRTLEQALLNLLDNAADASPDGIELHADWNDSMLRIDILDWGPGIDDAIASRIGEAFFQRQAGTGGCFPVTPRPPTAAAASASASSSPMPPSNALAARRTSRAPVAAP